MCWYNQNQYKCGHHGRLLLRKDPEHKQPCEGDLLVRAYNFPYSCNKCQEEKRQYQGEQRLHSPRSGDRRGKSLSSSAFNLRRSMGERSSSVAGFGGGVEDLESTGKASQESMRGTKEDMAHESEESMKESEKTNGEKEKKCAMH